MYSQTVTAVNDYQILLLTAGIDTLKDSRVVLSGFSRRYFKNVFLFQIIRLYLVLFPNFQLWLVSAGLG